MRLYHRLLLLLLLANLQPLQADMTERVGPDGVIYLSSEQSQPRVVMYAVPDCGYCVQARRYFTAQGIEFTEYNINRSAKRYREFLRYGGRGTPLLRIDGQTLHGFNRQAIDAALQ